MMQNFSPGVIYFCNIWLTLRSRFSVFFRREVSFVVIFTGPLFSFHQDNKVVTDADNLHNRQTHNLEVIVDVSFSREILIGLLTQSTNPFLLKSALTIHSL